MRPVALLLLVCCLPGLVTSASAAPVAGDAPSRALLDPLSAGDALPDVGDAGGDGAALHGDGDDGAAAESVDAARSRGDVGVEVTLAQRDGGAVADVAAVGDARVVTDAVDGGVAVRVSGAPAAAPVVVLHVDAALLPEAHDFTVRVDGVTARHVDGTHALAPGPGGAGDAAPTAVVWTSGGVVHVAVAAAHDGTHDITVESAGEAAPASLLPGVAWAVMLLLAAGAAMVRPWRRRRDAEPEMPVSR